ncbi:hypothetical protein RAH41_19770 [Gottfriedia acidiceleris]|uniref:hypothetical protein n=1 Tax=Gottfriedia acidiceleris TaxID=371036 RepID=UPI002F26A334
MAVIEKKKGTSFKVLLISLILVIGIIAVCFPSIQNTYNKISIKKTKIETSVTKTLTKDEIYKLERNQRKSANKYEKNNEWLYKEIKKGATMIEFNYDFMYDHPEYDSAKITFPVTKYKVNGKTVKFISNEGKINQVHSESGWVDK